MRIQIKVYIDAEKDQECAGQKPDFWVSAGTIDNAIEELYSLSKPIEDRKLGIKDEPEDFGTGAMEE